MQYVSRESWESLSRLVCACVRSGHLTARSVRVLALHVFGREAEERCVGSRPGHLPELGRLGFDLRKVPVGMSVWEGKWMPEMSSPGGASGESRPVGEFRELVPDEEACVLRGVSPWEMVELDGGSIVSGDHFVQSQRELVQGMGHVVVKAGDDVTLRITCPVDLCLEKIVFPHAAFGCFKLTRFSVGGVTPPWAVLPFFVVGESEAPVAVRRGQIVEVGACNITGDDLVFSAILTGVVVWPATESPVRET